MVSALDSKSRGLGSRPGRVNTMCSWAKHFPLAMPLSTQEWNGWVPANCQESLMKCWGAHLRWTGIPARGSSNTPSCCPLHGNQDKLRLARPIGSSTDLLWFRETRHFSFQEYRSETTSCQGNRTSSFEVESRSGSYNCFRLPQKRFSGVDHLIRFPGIGQITRGEVESISDYWHCICCRWTTLAWCRICVWGELDLPSGCITNDFFKGGAVMGTTFK